MFMADSHCHMTETNTYKAIILQLKIFFKSYMKLKKKNLRNVLLETYTEMNI